jgi:hypothetical protein
MNRVMIVLAPDHRRSNDDVAPAPQGQDRRRRESRLAVDAKTSFSATISETLGGQRAGRNPASWSRMIT